ncbi:MAG: EF2563 family selenium-dependent molybdenum hydroxylase system protein [Anaerolineae bacterium]|nr:EF2563 family selenium-dependent molybdenum hydroxylase system protein [Anaerolineae bacterium]
MNTNPIFNNCLIVIKGAGDLASGVAYRLKRAGFPLIMTELPAPLLVRRAVCFGEAVYSHKTTVEGITAHRVGSLSGAQDLARSEVIPVLVDPEAQLVKSIKPQLLVDATMAKANLGTSITDAPFVVALGPGFMAGQDCHAVVETSRGHWLGRVIYQGQAEPDTGTPGIVQGYGVDRVLRAPADGNVIAFAAIGDRIKQGQRIAVVGGQEVHAPFDGVLRGLVHSAVRVTTGLKIGDLDPRGIVEYCFTLSDKSLAVGGGVLEAIMASEVVRPKA